MPGTSRSSTLPRSSKPVPEPTTRSRTVRATRMSPGAEQKRPGWKRTAGSCFVLWFYSDTTLREEVSIPQLWLSVANATLCDRDCPCGHGVSDCAL